MNATRRKAIDDLRMLAALVLVTSTFALLDGCSKVADDYGTVPNPTPQAEAVQSALASAEAAQNRNALGTMPNGPATAPNPPMGLGSPDGASPSMNKRGPLDSAPIGVKLILGQPPMAGGSGADPGLPPAIGAPYIYHLGGDTFFLDRASAMGLTSEQHRRLMALKEQATISYATAQRKIDQGEQDLWVLSASDAPDIAKIETKVGEIASLNGQQRMAFIRTVGEAVSVLSDTQRKAAVSQGETMRPGAIQPAPSAAPMTAPQGSAGSMNQQGGVGSAGPKGGMAPMRDDDSMGKMGGTAPDKKSNNGGMGPM